MPVRDVLRADPQMKQQAKRADITKPGRAGIRPARLADLTGDGTTELLVAVDTETGRTILAAYTERDGKVYPILLTTAQRATIETVGNDLVMRSPSADGGEKAVRYHWDGARMMTVSDTTTYRKGGPSSVPESSKDLESPPPTSDGKSPDPTPTPTAADPTATNSATDSGRTPRPTP